MDLPGVRRRARGDDSSADRQRGQRAAMDRTSGSVGGVDRERRNGRLSAALRGQIPSHDSHRRDGLMYVCLCKGVTSQTVSEVAAQGALTTKKVAKACGAGSA